MAPKTMDVAATVDTTPRRISELLFRRDMLSPSSFHLASSFIGFLLVEKLVLEYMLPPWLPVLDQQIQAYGKLQFLLMSGTLVATLGFWGMGTVFALPALFGSKQWKIQEDKSFKMHELGKALPLIIFNFLFSMPFSALVLFALLPESATSFQKSALPSTMVLARDVMVWGLVYELLFFHVHRYLHENKKIYKAIHKLHHTWTAPISYVAIYAHPVEHVVSNLIPLLVGPIFCGSHIAAIGIFIFLGFTHTTAVHSGYWFCDDNGMHDEHHAKFNVNYGVTGVFDSYYGTYRLPAGAAHTSNASETLAVDDATNKHD